MRSIMRRRNAGAGVEFCEACSQVSTAQQRARQRYEDAAARVYSVLLPR